jgi:tRNA pseudouridine32 synthase / 23S rRNA pseudouridine746 synthase
METVKNISVMPLLYALSDFGHAGHVPTPDIPTDWYEGVCPNTGQRLRLPRTQLAEAIAQGLIQQLMRDRRYGHEGKMYGVLLAVTPEGEPKVLKAFSGLLTGCAEVAGWVPPILGRDRLAFAEAQTLAALNIIKQDLLTLQHLSVRQHYPALQATWEDSLQALNLIHAQRKHQRQHQRQQHRKTLTGTALESALARLDQASQQDGIERKGLKRDRDRQLQPLKHQIEQADSQIQVLRQRRKRLSQRLQAQMQTTYSLTNFAGESLSLQQVMGSVLPTGSGECCAPKLLHYAATHHLKPLALAEFWWGPPSPKGDKLPGRFYGACVERCQPLMGFLLSGLTPPAARADDFSILYMDDELIAVDKPAGLLSVPGRTRDRQDSVLTRLRVQWPDDSAIAPAHRLDQDTSGVLVFARNAQSHRHLSQQFQDRHVHKVYEAILEGEVMTRQGVIDLPLWGNPEHRPHQTVDWHRGKPSITHFRVMGLAQTATRVEFIPLTGRTHQLRVHAATAAGLGVPILGDRLYGSPTSTGSSTSTQRLHLHACELHLHHPQSGQRLVLRADVPF